MRGIISLLLLVITLAGCIEIPNREFLREMGVSHQTNDTGVNPDDMGADANDPMDTSAPKDASSIPTPDAIAADSAMLPADAQPPRLDSETHTDAETSDARVPDAVVMDASTPIDGGVREDASPVVDMFVRPMCEGVGDLCEPDPDQCAVGVPSKISCQDGTPVCEGCLRAQVFLDPCREVLSDGQQFVYSGRNPQGYAMCRQLIGPTRANKVTVEADDAGRPLREVRRLGAECGEGEPYQVWWWTWNNDQVQLLEIRQPLGGALDMPGPILFTITFGYDVDGFLISEERRDSNNRLAFTLIYEYDQGGNIRLKRETFRHGGNPLRDFIYEYSGCGIIFQ